MNSQMTVETLPDLPEWESGYFKTNPSQIPEPTHITSSFSNNKTLTGQAGTKPNEVNSIGPSGSFKAREKISRSASSSSGSSQKRNQRAKLMNEQQQQQQDRVGDFGSTSIFSSSSSFSSSFSSSSSSSFSSSPFSMGSDSEFFFANGNLNKRGTRNRSGTGMEFDFQNSLNVSSFSQGQDQKTSTQSPLPLPIGAAAAAQIIDKNIADEIEKNKTIRVEDELKRQKWKRLIPINSSHFSEEQRKILADIDQILAAKAKLEQPIVKLRAALTDKYKSLNLEKGQKVQLPNGFQVNLASETTVSYDRTSIKHGLTCFLVHKKSFPFELAETFTLDFLNYLFDTARECSEPRWKYKITKPKTSKQKKRKKDDDFSGNHSDQEEKDEKKQNPSLNLDLGFSSSTLSSLSSVSSVFSGPTNHLQFPFDLVNRLPDPPPRKKAKGGRKQKLWTKLLKDIKKPDLESDHPNPNIKQED